MDSYKPKKALCFDLNLNNKNSSKLIIKYKFLLEDICKDRVDVVMFDKHNIKEFIKNKIESNIFYFKREGLLDYYRKFLRMNNIIEDNYQLVGEKKYAPTSFIIKKNDYYVKLFTLNRGDDDSFYINFTGDYSVDSIERTDIILRKTISLKKIKVNIKNPYISYHSKSGIIHSKDYYGEYFITNLKTINLDDSIKNNSMFPFCAIVISPNYHLLPNIGKPPIETNKFNYIEINSHIPTVIKTGLKAESFITFNHNLLKPNHTLTIELWLHKKNVGADIFNSLTRDQKKNIISYITLNNEISDMSWTVFFRHVTLLEYDDIFSLILQIFNNQEYTMCRINRSL